MLQKRKKTTKTCN